MPKRSVSDEAAPPAFEWHCGVNNAELWDLI
jgi:hypothetical protein